MNKEMLQRLEEAKNHYSHYSFMFGNVSILPEGWELMNEYLMSCLQTMVFAFIFYFLVSSLSYLFFFIFRKKTYTPRREEFLQYEEQVMFDIKWSLINILGQSPLVAVIKLGYPYFSRVQYEWKFSSALFGFFLLHVLYDQFLTYWVHRILHWPFFYKHFHAIHHKSKAVTPFSGFAFHPLDAFSQAIPVFTSCYFLPLPIDLVLAHGIITSIWAISIHDNVNLLPFKGILYAGSHSIHHFPWGENYNFGKITSVCDRLYGSYCDPEGITGYGYKLGAKTQKFFDTLNKWFEIIVPDNGKKKVEEEARKFVKKIE